MRDETFGPTLPVMKVRDAAEAIEMANDSRFGLSGSIWTLDKAKGMALARQMNSGTVNINNVVTGILQFRVPMPGRKDSGPGTRSGGAEGIRQVLPNQEHRGRAGRHEEGATVAPVPRGRYKALAGLAGFLSAKDWRRKLGP